MEQKPLISIGIVTYNRLGYLKRSLESALEQGDAVMEVVVVNDGSTDGTKEYLDGLKSERVRAVHFESNCGRPTARNEVVARIKGDFLLWVDDDDALAEQGVALQLESLARHPEADIIYGNHVACDEFLNPQTERESTGVASGHMLMHLMYEDIVPNGGTLIRKSVFSRVGNYDLSFLRAQDYDFWVRAAVAGCVFLHNNRPIYYFRFHERNLANPEINRDQSRYHCRIVAKALASAPIEKIFPILDWHNNPEESAAKALLFLARIFFDHGDDGSALECIELSEGYDSSDEASIMKGYVYRAMSRWSESADVFAKLMAKLNPSYAGMLVNVGAPRGSVAVAEQARKNKSQQEVEFGSYGT